MGWHVCCLSTTNQLTQRFPLELYCSYKHLTQAKATRSPFLLLLFCAFLSTSACLFLWFSLPPTQTLSSGQPLPCGERSIDRVCKLQRGEFPNSRTNLLIVLPHKEAELGGCQAFRVPQCLACVSDPQLQSLLSAQSMSCAAPSMHMHVGCFLSYRQAASEWRYWGPVMV